MKEELYENSLEEQEETIDYRELFFKYLIHWPWFIASTVVCVLLAVVYLYFSMPVYNIQATIMIKDDKKGGNMGSTLTAFQEMDLINTSQNIDNEIEVLKSKTLMKKVVNDLQLYTRYFVKDKLKEKELYRNEPISVSLLATEAERLSGPVEFQLRNMGANHLMIELTLQEKSKVYRVDSLPALLVTEAGTFRFARNESYHPKDSISEMAVRVCNPLGLAMGYAGALTIEPTSKTTSVATIGLKATNRQRGKDIINKLIALYNEDTNNDKNEVAQSTARFIDERIAVINKELGSTEMELETFKRTAGLTDVSTDAQHALAENTQYEKLRVENGTQLGLVKYLSDYLNNRSHVNEPLPVNVGLNDQSLTVLINQYNELILERNRLLRNSSESNPVVRKLDSSIRDMKQNVATSIVSVRRGLLITKADLDRQANKYAGRISDAPTKEREYVSIQRQQEIQAGLYLMLLQKREENNITLAATANNAKIIDDALASGAPVSPKKQLILLIALVLGIGIPVGIIYVGTLLKYKIEGRADVEKLTRLPILADVAISEALINSKGHQLAVQENKNDLMAETFRNIRTGLLFMLPTPEEKVILVTSTQSGEGKTFIACNLAASLALLGKKVLVMGLDIRKPGLNKVFKISHKEKGITQFLANPQTLVEELIRPTGVDGLDVMPGGMVPPNPTELLGRKRFDELMATLRQRYDYIVLDTAPVGMVSDTQLIARVADVTLFICRADFTPKADFGYINDICKRKVLPNMSMVINGIDLKQKKYGYYYGYGKYGKYGKYGYYGKHYYGYGYGYGYGEETKK